MAIDWESEAKRRVAARVAGFNKQLDRLNRKPRKTRTAADRSNGLSPLSGQLSNPEQAETRDVFSTPIAVERAFQLGIEMDKEREERELAENCRWLLLSQEERAAEVAEWIPRIQELLEDFRKIRDPRMRFTMTSAFTKKLDEMFNSVENDEKSPFTM